MSTNKDEISSQLNDLLADLKSRNDFLRNEHKNKQTKFNQKNQELSAVINKFKEDYEGTVNASEEREKAINILITAATLEVSVAPDEAPPAPDLDAPIASKSSDLTDVTGVLEQFEKPIFQPPKESKEPKKVKEPSHQDALANIIKKRRAQIEIEEETEGSEKQTEQLNQTKEIKEKAESKPLQRVFNLPKKGATIPQAHKASPLPTKKEEIKPLKEPELSPEHQKFNKNLKEAKENGNISKRYGYVLDHLSALVNPVTPNDDVKKANQILDNLRIQAGLKDSIQAFEHATIGIEVQLQALVKSRPKETQLLSALNQNLDAVKSEVAEFEQEKAKLSEASTPAPLIDQAASSAPEAPSLSEAPIAPPLDAAPEAPPMDTPEAPPIEAVPEAPSADAPPPGAPIAHRAPEPAAQKEPAFEERPIEKRDLQLNPITPEEETKIKYILKRTKKLIDITRDKDQKEIKDIIKSVSSNLGKLTENELKQLKPEDLNKVKKILERPKRDTAKEPLMPTNEMDIKALLKKKQLITDVINDPNNTEIKEMIEDISPDVDSLNINKLAQLTSEDLKNLITSVKTKEAEAENILGKKDEALQSRLPNQKKLESFIKVAPPIKAEDNAALDPKKIIDSILDGANPSKKPDAPHLDEKFKPLMGILSTKKSKEQKLMDEAKALYDNPKTEQNHLEIFLKSQNSYTPPYKDIKELKEGVNRYIKNKNRIIESLGKDESKINNTLSNLKQGKLPESKDLEFVLSLISKNSTSQRTRMNEANDSYEDRKIKDFIAASIKKLNRPDSPEHYKSLDEKFEPLIVKLRTEKIKAQKLKEEAEVLKKATEKQVDPKKTKKAEDNLKAFLKANQSYEGRHANLKELQNQAENYIQKQYRAVTSLDYEENHIKNALSDLRQGNFPKSEDLLLILSLISNDDLANLTKQLDAYHLGIKTRNEKDIQDKAILFDIIKNPSDYNEPQFSEMREGITKLFGKNPEKLSTGFLNRIYEYAPYDNIAQLLRLHQEGLKISRDKVEQHAKAKIGDYVKKLDETISTQEKSTKIYSLQEIKDLRAAASKKLAPKPIESAPAPTIAIAPTIVAAPSEPMPVVAPSAIPQTIGATAEVSRKASVTAEVKMAGDKEAVSPLAKPGMGEDIRSIPNLTPEPLTPTPEIEAQMQLSTSLPKTSSVKTAPVIPEPSQPPSPSPKASPEASAQPKPIEGPDAKKKSEEEINWWDEQPTRGRRVTGEDEINWDDLTTRGRKVAEDRGVARERSKWDSARPPLPSSTQWASAEIKRRIDEINKNIKKAPEKESISPGTRKPLIMDGAKVPRERVEPPKPETSPKKNEPPRRGG